MERTPCDREHAETAQNKAIKQPGGHVLTLCQHHTDQYRLALLAAGWLIMPLLPASRRWSRVLMSA